MCLEHPPSRLIVPQHSQNYHSQPPVSSKTWPSGWAASGYARSYEAPAYEGVPGGSTAERTVRLGGYALRAYGGVTTTESRGANGTFLRPKVRLAYLHISEDKPTSSRELSYVGDPLGVRLTFGRRRSARADAHIGVAACSLRVREGNVETSLVGCGTRSARMSAYDKIFSTSAWRPIKRTSNRRSRRISLLPGETRLKMRFAPLCFVLLVEIASLQPPSSRMECRRPDRQITYKLSNNYYEKNADGIHAEQPPHNYYVTMRPWSTPLSSGCSPCPRSVPRTGGWAFGNSKLWDFLHIGVGQCLSRTPQKARVVPA